MNDFFENFIIGFIGSLILIGLVGIVFLPVAFAIVLDRAWILWFLTVTVSVGIGFIYAASEGR